MERRQMWRQEASLLGSSREVEGGSQMEIYRVQLLLQQGDPRGETELFLWHTSEEPTKG